MPLFNNLERAIVSLNQETISNERKNTLQPLIHFIQEKVTGNKQIRLYSICTHNSRRSHLSQVWAQALAYYFNI
ncbi:MAG TPA: protein-tyrosine-phosphatase, partial [Mariniflexile sp.]|nr:protein-tyrosine-phosphatase [Mariniflexile sp.]